MIPCGGGIILKTIDGGNNWIQLQAGDTRALYTIDVIDSLHIEAAGSSGKNVYSSDGGVIWISNQDLPAFTSTNWIDFIDADTGYSVQDVYDIRKTTDKGQTWFIPASNVTSEWHIQLLDDGTGFACGDDFGDALSFFKRNDGLDRWERIFLNYNWNDVFFINEMKGFFTGNLSVDYVLYKTEDGEISYQKVENAPGGDDLLFIDSLTGFLGGDLIYKTTDGGDTWYVPDGGQGGAGQIYFINDEIGWAIRSNIIYNTTDSGENWFTQFTAPASVHFTSINFSDTLHGWISGGRPYKTTDGGNNWVQQTNTTLWNSDDVYFTNQDTGWFGKYSSINNSFFKTTDGGLAWVVIPEVIGARKFYFFPDPIHWLIIGFSQYYITNDYGNNWIEFTNDVPGGLTSFFAPTDNLGFAVGSGGLILRYDDGVTNISPSNEKIIPDRFYLYQNSPNPPNPFNPATKIKFSIPLVETHRDASLLVKLIVYDVLGNEIAALVNEEMPAGEYEVEFSGTNFPSGVYFCQLRAEDYIQAIKMLLLK